MGKTTYRATKDIFDYERLEPVMASDKSEPLHIWRALNARSRYGAALPGVPATPFVGRDLDLAVLTNAHGRSVRESSV